MGNQISHSKLNDKLRVYLRSYLPIIDSVIDEIIKQEENMIPKNVLSLLMQSIGASSNTIFEIADKPEFRIKDCYIIMRSIIETSINACLIFADTEYAIKAHEHALQKTARFMNRELEVGSFTFRTLNAENDNFLQQENVKNALSKFQKHSPWTPEKLPEKIKIIENIYGPQVNLSGAYYAIYSEAAELIHGSYFGIINLYGLNKSINFDVQEKFLSVQTEILFHAISCLKSTIVIANKTYRLSKQEKMSAEIFNAALKKTESFLKEQIL